MGRNDLRRSLRIPLSVPLVVSDPRPPGFSECCETVMANSHGCQLRSYRPLATGMQVRLDAIYTSRTARATVVHSEPVGRERDATVWNCGLAFEKPGNFLGILSPPCDWSSAASSADAEVTPPVPNPAQPQQMLAGIDARIACLEARVERATAEFESVALARLQQSFGEAIKQGQERMKRFAAACGESRLVGLETELEHRLEPLLARSQAATSELERLLETLREEQHAWEARMAQQHQQQEDRFRGWLAEETQRFHALVHDGVVEASGRIRGRIDAATETACETLERRARDVQAHLETLILRQTGELSRSCEGNLSRLHAVQEEMERSFPTQLAARQAEALDLFQLQANEAMMQTIAHMRMMLNNALGTVAQAWQSQPPVSPAQPPGPDGAGSGRPTHL